MNRQDLCYAVQNQQLCQASPSCTWTETCEAFESIDDRTSCFVFCGSKVDPCAESPECQEALSCVVEKTDCDNECITACQPSSVEAKALFLDAMVCFKRCADEDACPFLSCSFGCSDNICLPDSNQSTTPEPPNSIHLCAFPPASACVFNFESECALATLGKCEALQHSTLDNFGLTNVFTRTTKSLNNPDAYDIGLFTTSDCLGSFLGFGELAARDLADEECRPLVAPLIGPLVSVDYLLRAYFVLRLTLAYFPTVVLIALDVLSVFRSRAVMCLAASAKQHLGLATAVEVRLAWMSSHHLSFALTQQKTARIHLIVSMWKKMYVLSSASLFLSETGGL